LSKINSYNIPEKSGIYVIRYIKNGRPFKISRLYGIDKKGIISIGETKDLNKRLKEFYKTVEGQRKSSNHAAGWYYVSCKYDRLFKKDGLQFKFKITESKKEAEREEFILLAKYRNKFLDLPPLNNNPGKYPEKDWEDIMKAIFKREPLKG